MMELFRLWIWSRWLACHWYSRYYSRWIVPRWSFWMFVWRWCCEKKNILTLCSFKGKIIGGWVEINTRYKRGEDVIDVTNACWVSWKTQGNGLFLAQQAFLRGLQKMQQEGIDYMIGAAHIRYTRNYWERFLRRSGFIFFKGGEYEMWIRALTGGITLSVIPLGVVRKLKRGEESELVKLFQKREGFLLEMGKRWREELSFPGCSETWVYEKEGEILGWFNGWFYDYDEERLRKRGVFIRWLVMEKLSPREKADFFERVCEVWARHFSVIIVPSFVAKKNMLEQLGFTPTDERYSLFFVDLQGKGQRKLEDFGGLYVF